MRPLILKGRIFDNCFIQGPLAGVSAAPFRKLCHEYSAPAFCCSEMISCKTLLQPIKRIPKRYVFKDPAEGLLCLQLSGNDPNELAIAVQKAQELGADLIDLNCGCPVKKIRNKGAGSRLLTDPSTLYQLIRAMKNNTDLPVSIKIRVEGQSGLSFHEDIVKAVMDAELDFLVVHGRHWEEDYKTACRHDHIQFFVDALNIPVIGNGDIQDLASLEAMLQTGCAGVMLARFGVGQPWLIKQLRLQQQGKVFSLPSLREIGQLLIRHIAELAALDGEKSALLQARKLAKYYARPLVERDVFLLAINSCDSFDRFCEVVRSYLK